MGSSALPSVTVYCTLLPYIPFFLKHTSHCFTISTASVVWSLPVGAAAFEGGTIDDERVHQRRPGWGHKRKRQPLPQASLKFLW